MGSMQEIRIMAKQTFHHVKLLIYKPLIMQNHKQSVYQN